jgi:hypothetical protein
MPNGRRLTGRGQTGFDSQVEARRGLIFRPGLDRACAHVADVVSPCYT